MDDNWHDKQPHNTASVRWLIGTSPAAERALWRYLCSIDWVTRVKSGWRAPDDLLPFFLPDPRAARITWQADWMWVRILDVVRALEARTYAGDGTLVLEVTDRAGLVGGRYLVEASPTGGTCTPTSQSAQLTLDVGSWRHSGSGTSRRCDSRRSGGFRKNERAPPDRPTPAAYVQAALVPGHVLRPPSSTTVGLFIRSRALQLWLYR